VRRARQLALALALAFCASTAQALESDDAARQLVNDALDLTRTRKYKEALEKLAQAQAMCRKEAACDPTVKAEVYLAQGISYGLDKQLDEAQKRFEWALAENPAAVPDDRYTTRAVREAFDKAKANVDAGSGAQPPQPAGKLSAEQKGAIDAARDQLSGGDWEGCLQTMIASTAVEEYAAGKLMLARCQDKGGLLIEAHRDAEAARELAQKDGDDGLVKEIDDYLESLEGETPKIRLKIHGSIKEPIVKIDNTEVAAEKVKDPIPHNPGTAVVEVTGKRGGQPFEFRQEIKFQRRETIDLEVRSDVTPYQACINKARTLSEREDCDRTFNVEQGLTVRGALEVSSYNDDDNVDVLSPALSVSADQPTDGWSVGGTVLVDVVTTASADIVATASRRFDEVRFAASLGGGYKIGPITPSLSASVSAEPDYIGRTVGAQVSADLLDKQLTPYVGYAFGFDIIGRADTDFSVFSRNFYRHAISAGASAVFDASTVGLLAVNVQIEDGDQSKPYRHVPLFPAETVDELPRGASPQLVATLRDTLPMPLEQLPTERQRYAVLARINHRLEPITIRGDVRGYIDSWGQKAVTGDFRMFWDFYAPEDESGGLAFPQLRLGPHLRGHFQGPVDFWQRAYVGTDGVGTLVIPVYRTGDRELGPLFGVTFGADLHADVNEVVGLGVLVQGTYTQYLDHLYLYDRWGIFTASTLEIEID
jgi:tetratricopeptide (TPR) repeat protein